MNRAGEKLGRRLNVRRMLAQPGREDGAVAIMFIGSIFVIFGVCGLALDLSMLYNRKMEMQSVADTAVLAAAAELNGTADGIANAITKASDRFASASASQLEVGRLTYQYSTHPVKWLETAIKFSSSPSGGWVDAGTAKARPDGLQYVKFDTADLDPRYGQVNTIFIQLLSPSFAGASTSAHAVAGPTAIKVAPLAVCAMRTEPARDRGNGELQEYGFRRGVGYDLMQLNPDATGQGKNFLINPLAPPGSIGSLPSADLKSVKPFICTGTMAMQRVTGGALTVESPFPLSDLYQQLNSRFDNFTAPCNPYAAPPDANVKEYVFNTGTSPYNASVPWMAQAPSGQTAALSTAGNKRWTVADPDTLPTGTTELMFGPLWSYAKAARYAASPPAGGYTPFDTSAWPTLYHPSLRASTSVAYPDTPYSKTGGTTFRAPPSGRKGVRERRVLNVPLLDCSAGRGTVLAIGKFFMTVQATQTALYAEFGGLVPEQSLATDVELYP